MCIKKVSFTPFHPSVPEEFRVFTTQYEEQLGKTIHKLCCNQITTKT